MLQASRWTFYLDDVAGQKQACSEKWLGGIDEGQVVVVNVRPDGYVGSIGRWANSQAELACQWLDDYYGGFLRG